MEDFLDEMRAIRAKYMESQNAGDAEGCASHWHPDGTIMPPNHESVYGPEALVSFYSATFTAVSMDATFDYHEAYRSGDLAFARGSYTASITDKASGATFEDRGKVLEVLRRSSDGTWLWHAHTWSSDLGG